MILGLDFQEAAVALSVYTGVGGCRCPKEFDICRIICAVWQLEKMPAVSASAAEETTCLSILHSTWISSLIVDGGVIEEDELYICCTCNNSWQCNI